MRGFSDTKYVVFDKTGTLTKGVFEVTGVYPENGYTKDSIVRLAAYSESASSHPISLSLKKYYGKDIDENNVKDIKEIAGHGVSAAVDGKRVLVGNLKLMKKSISLSQPSITRVRLCMFPRTENMPAVL